MLQGIPSRIFELIEGDGFDVKVVRLPSTSAGSLFSYLQSLSLMGSKFHRIEVISKFLVEDSTRKGLLGQAFGSALGAYLQFLRTQLTPPKGLMDLLIYLQPLKEQLNSLVEFCGCVKMTFF